MSFLKKSTDAFIQKKVYSFIEKNFPLRRSLNNDDSFLEKGIIDSTGILELVEFIESTFHVEIQDDELIPDNLDSINKIVEFVKRKLE